MSVTIWIVCAFINFAIAILHIYIIFAGAPAYAYYGAGDWMVSKAKEGSFIPAAITWAVTAVFFVFACYSMAGANIIAMPYLLYGLVTITALYLLRGSLILAIPFMSQRLTRFDKVSSYLAFSIGLLHLLGLYFLYMDIKQI
jgi:hypothetical protein